MLMRSSVSCPASSTFALALGLLFAAAPVAAQQQPPTTPPPGSPQSSQQDDDPTGSATQDNDTAATAAESAPPLETGPGTNEIVVTGSRIARPEFAFPNPIQAYTAETIAQAGDTNITDFLVDSPALIGSTTSTDTAGSNLATGSLTGVNFLDLRNLGEKRTLVLVDGRRHVSSFQGVSSVDTNTIPIDLIERVDVLTGGTSAIYGADGVSGVVNFILKRNFEGLSIRGQAGISQRGDAGNRYVAATYGRNFADDRGNVALSYEYNITDRFSQRERLNYGRTGPTYVLARNRADIPDDPALPDRILYTDVRWADSSPGGAIDIDFDFVPDFTGEGGVYDTGDYIPRTAFTVGGSSTPRESYFGDYTPFTKRHNFNALTSFEFSEAFRVFGQAKYVRAKGRTLSQPNYDFYTQLYADNAYLNQQFPAAVDGALITGRDNFDFGIREGLSDRKTARGVLGADGKLGDHLRYEMSLTYGQTKTQGNNTNTRIMDRYYASLDAVVDPLTGKTTCRINLPGETLIQSFSYNNVKFGTYDPLSGNYLGAPVSFRPGECVPVNVLGSGAPSQEALNFFQTDDIDHSKITQTVLSGSLAGDSGRYFSLPGGPVGFAVGAEYRKETSRYEPSNFSLLGFLENAPGARDKGQFSVKEAFAEINLPVLKDVPGAYTLSAGGALRLSDYTTIGSTKTWSVNGVYAPIRDITFRGTLSQAVRAPNLGELFANPAGTFEFITDPCGIDRLAEGSSTRVANCTTALTALGFDPTTFDPGGDFTSPENSSIVGRTGGNRNLHEETARTWTLGGVLRPRFIPGMTVSADWYDIRIKQAINTGAAQDLVDQCYDGPTLDNSFCTTVGRDPRTGYIATFTTRPENVASFDTEGLDVALNYRFRPSAEIGSFNLRVNGNYLKKLQFIPTAGGEVDDDRGEPFAPKYSATGDVTWTKGKVTLNYGVNYFSKTRRYTTEQVEAQPDIAEKRYIFYKPKWEHEAQAAIDIDKRLNLYAGVNNLFDTKPDVAASGYPISAVGRFFYIGAKAKLF
jgi:outer membrane receptor protein involved in Fe transport